MKFNIVVVASILLPMLALDALWLLTMLNYFYVPRIGSLMAQTPNFAAAGVFYLIYALGIAYFVVVPAVQSGAVISKVFLTGAFLGFLAYATYDLTNQATLRDWPLSLTVVDMAWGTLLTATVSVIACSLTRHFVK